MSNENVEIVDVIWLPANVGFILVKDKITKKNKIYMGGGLGLDEVDDINYILSLGKKMEGQEMIDFANYLQAFATEKTN